jgi:predicted enzyme related to lactoylglutathione lyase
MEAAMNSVVHFEIPVDDIDAAVSFYRNAFGWDIRQDDMPGGGTYTSAITTPSAEDGRPKDPGAINGAIIQREAQLSAPVVTVNVDSIEDVETKVTGAGGQVVVSKQTIPGLGEYSYVLDPAGNVVGLWHSLTS